MLKRKLTKKTPFVAMALALAAAPSVLVLSSQGSSAFAVEDAGNGALAQLRRSNDRIDKLLKQNRNDAEPQRKSEMKGIVNGFLDYDELAKRSLSQHWDPLKPAQRESFVKTLRELIEKNYVRQLKNNLDYEVIYKQEAVDGEVATVGTVVKVRTRGKSTDMPIDYKLRKKAERWMVFDVITDEVSMVQNYKSQFHKIITQESFEALLKKMQKKIDEPEKVTKTAQGPATVDGKVDSKVDDKVVGKPAAPPSSSAAVKSAKADAKSTPTGK